MTPWTDEEGRREAVAWATARLDDRRLAVDEPVEQPHVQWWSTVLRLPTPAGDFFLKATRDRFEPPLTELLAKLRPEATVELAATDTTRGWMLTHDAGTRLREAAPGREQLPRWEELLPLYAQLQIDLASRREELLDLGVPDRRLALLPSQLRAAAGDAPREFGELCERLAVYGIPETLQHDDLHDGNLFVRDGGYVFFDWGDACVSHPFHTLVVTLRALAWRLELPPGGADVLRLRDAYLDPWTAFASRAELVAAAELARRTGTIQRAIAWHDYCAAMPPDVRAEHEEAVPYGLDLYREDGPWGTWE